jgi:integrase
VISERGRGSLYQSRGCWFVSLSLKSRISIRLSACKNKPDADLRRTVVADIALRLKQGGHLDMAETICRRAGEVPDDALPALLGLVAGLLRGSETIALKAEVVTRPSPPTDLTFGEFSRQWTSNVLADQHRRRVRRIDHSENVIRLQKHVYPITYGGRTIAATPLAEFTLDHAEHVLRQPTLSEGSVRHVAQCLHRVLALAVYPARVLQHSPLPRGWLPPPNAVKARSYLFPVEDAAIMRNEKLPLVRRLFLGFCAREGPRVSNVVRLTWANLTLDVGPGRSGRAVIDHTKNGEPLHWVLDPGTTEALRRWRLICPSRVWVFPAEAVPRYRRSRRGNHMAIGSIALHLRKALETADVERREQLFQRDAFRLRLRAHDLRATFITLALAQGRSEDWVRTRTGHRTSQMIARYRLEAKTAQELELGWLLPLHEVIPELAALGPEEPSPERELSANCRHPPESAPIASAATLH